MVTNPRLAAVWIRVMRLRTFNLCIKLAGWQKLVAMVSAEDTDTMLASVRSHQRDNREADYGGNVFDRRTATMNLLGLTFINREILYETLFDQLFVSSRIGKFRGRSSRPRHRTQLRPFRLALRQHPKPRGNDRCGGRC